MSAHTHKVRIKFSTYHEPYLDMVRLCTGSESDIEFLDMFGLLQDYQLYEAGVVGKVGFIREEYGENVLYVDGKRYGEVSDSNLIYLVEE